MIYAQAFYDDEPLSYGRTSPRMTNPTGPVEFVNVVCPLCGLGCDDLQVKIDGDTVELVDGGCAVSRRGFQQASLDKTPTSQIDGRGASLDQAVARAAEILRNARLPLLTGLATDVQGARAIVTLAQHCNGVLDHMYSPGLFRNLHVLQDTGWVTTSLTEVRNRSDLIVVAGERVFEQFPRLLERVLHPSHCLFRDSAPRELVLIGPWKPSNLPPELADWRPTIIPVALSAIGQIVGTLRAMIAEQPLHVCKAAGVEIHKLENLARRMQRAKYSTVAWAAGELDFPHAELTVQSLVELVRDLNRTTRSAALPLGGAQGGITAQQVCMWRTGQPLRSAFISDEPRHDSIRYDYRRLLAGGHADALLWLSSFVPYTPLPETEAPTIVLGHPNLSVVQTPAVYIPVGIPGIDHAGHAHRGDQVVVLPLRRLRESMLPPANEVINLITAAL